MLYKDDLYETEKVVLQFIMDNLIACIAVAVVFSAFITIVAIVIVKEVNRRNQEKLEKSMMDIPVIADDEIAATDSGEENVRKGDADLKWVRVQSFELADETDKTATAENDNGEDTMAKKTKEEEKKVTAKKAPAKKVAPKAEEPKKAVKADVKKAPEKKEPAKKPTAKKTVGKWVVKEKGEGEFVSYLYANNGEIILTSEIYASADSAKKGIATIKKSIEGAGFQFYCDKNRNYYFKLKNASNRFLCVGETYPTRATCVSASESVKRFADSPISDEIVKDVTIMKYVAPKQKAVDKKTTYTGKWVIVEVEEMYIAQLFASNGELLLSSEAYTTASSAKSAIETITTNGKAGNFIIDVDKKGRFFFKLRNSQKSTLCVGETYSQLGKCQSAIDSVRRFLETAKLVD